MEGLQLSPLSVAADTSEMFAVLLTPLARAVTVAVESPERVPLVALNVVEEEPEGTVTEVGVVKLELLSLTETAKPLPDAALVSVTVQVEVCDGPKEDGLQLRLLGTGGACKVSVAVLVTLLAEAVIVADALELT